MYIMSALPEDHRCSKYADYLFEFKQCNILLDFPSRNVGLQPIKQQRTNTAAESIHAQFNAQFYTAHPTFFIFLDSFKATWHVKSTWIFLINMQVCNITTCIWRTEGVIRSNLVITWKIRSFVWFFNPLLWLYGLPFISYSVTVWFPLKRNSPA